MNFPFGVFCLKSCRNWHWYIFCEISLPGVHPVYHQADTTSSSQLLLFYSQHLQRWLVGNDSLGLLENFSTSSRPPTTGWRLGGGDLQDISREDSTIALQVGTQASPAGIFGHSACRQVSCSPAQGSISPPRPSWEAMRATRSLASTIKSASIGFWIIG